MLLVAGELQVGGLGKGEKGPGVGGVEGAGSHCRAIKGRESFQYISKLNQDYPRAKPENRRNCLIKIVNDWK